MQAGNFSKISFSQEDLSQYLTNQRGKIKATPSTPNAKIPQSSDFANFNPQDCIQGGREWTIIEQNAAERQRRVQASGSSDAWDQPYADR